MVEAWFGIARPENINRSEEEVSAALEGFLRIHELGQEDGNSLNIALAGKLELMPRDFEARYREQERTRRAGAFTAHLLFGWDAPSEVMDLLQLVRTNPDAAADKESLRRLGAVKEPIDLIIRTGVGTASQGGRLSGAVPWHSPNAEIYFTPVLSPDLTRTHLEAALAEYAHRKAPSS